MSIVSVWKLQTTTVEYIIYFHIILRIEYDSCNIFSVTPMFKEYGLVHFFIFKLFFVSLSRLYEKFLSPVFQNKAQYSGFLLINSEWVPASVLESDINTSVVLK